MKTRSVKFNFVMNFLLTASSLVFPLITHPYVARVLLPEGLGKATFASSVVNWFIMLAMLGVPTYGIRACARVRDDRQALSKTVQELMIINAVMAALCYVLLGVAVALTGRLRQMKLLIWVTASGIALNALGVNWFYSALEEYGYITVRSLIFKVISIAVMFVFVRSPDDVVWYAVVILIASYGSYVLNFIRLKKYITFRRFSHYSFWPHIRVSLIFFAMSVATTVYTNLDTVMLDFMAGDTQVGYYTTAVRVKQILVSLVTSLGAVLLPRLSWYVKQGSRERFRATLHKALRFVVFVSVPLTVFFMLQARDTVLLLAGPLYEPAIPSMVVIMPTVLLIGLTNLIGMQLMVPLGREKQVTLSVCAGGAVDLVLNALLIGRFGALGAALGTLAAELVVLCVQLGLARGLIRGDSESSVSSGQPYTQERRPSVTPSVWQTLLRSLMRAAAAAVPAGLAAWAVSRLLGHTTSVTGLIVRLAAGAAVFGGVYAAAAFLLRDPALREDLLPAIRSLVHPDREKEEL